MPKKSYKMIVEDEKKILDTLLKDSKQSINTIANKLKFSRQTVWRIIKRLEKNNTIWGYTAVIDDDKMGVNSYVVLIKRTTEPIDKKIVEKIINSKLDPVAKKLDVNINLSYYINGIYDWVICFKAKNIIVAKQFCDILRKEYQGYISDLQLLEVLFWAKKQGIVNPEIEKLEEFQ